MSGCIKDLYNYELVKKCSKCEIISLKSNFCKDITKKLVMDLLAKFAVKIIIIIMKIEY